MKRTIKNRIKKTSTKCHISKVELPEEYSLYDTHRKTPKRNGGTYTDGNTVLVMPTEHMKEHNILRERPEEINVLKTMIDDRSQLMKLKNKINNQLLAYKRGTDHPNQSTVDFLTNQLAPITKELSKKDKEIGKYVKMMVDPLGKAAMKVPSIGPITVAYCLAYIDIKKARHASSLWAYVGLDKPSHERYEKGTSGGGNKTLRTVLYTMADSQIKGRGPYRTVYDNVKTRLEHSEKIVKSRNTQGKLVEIAWKDAKPSHRHGAAIRAMIKHFLADYWFVGRALAGLPTSPIYAEAMLGGTHRTIQPEERGWKY